MTAIQNERLVAFTQALVRERSLSGQERSVVERIVGEMRALGFDRVWVDGNGSAVGVIEGMRPGPTLLFDGHCDTVGIAPGSHWTRDPFEGQVEGGHIFGRGVADMKGALAAVLHAAAGADRTRLAERIAVSATVVEEVLEGVSLRSVREPRGQASPGQAI